MQFSAFPTEFGPFLSGLNRIGHMWKSEMHKQPVQSYYMPLSSTIFRYILPVAQMTIGTGIEEPQVGKSANFIPLESPVVTRSRVLRVDCRCIGVG